MINDTQNPSRQRVIFAECLEYFKFDLRQAKKDELDLKTIRILRIFFLFSQVFEIIKFDP